MQTLEDVRAMLALANRILAHEEVVDAFGHVSARHPECADRFLLSRSLSPALVMPDDIMEHDLSGEPIDDGRPAYLERFIHAGIYARRPDVHAIVHHHAHEILPFTVTGVPLRPIIHMAGAIGAALPVWDIAREFGDTDLLVTNMEHARSLADTLDDETVALMRGHGAVVTGATVRDAVLIAIYTKVNARLLTTALSLGEVTYLSPKEVGLTRRALLGPNPAERAWNHYLSRVPRGAGR